MPKNFTLILATLVCLGFVTATRADTLNGRVVHIADGDTLTLLDTNNQQFIIRLKGIDAPERLQAFGSKSQASLGAILSDQATVHVEWTQRDDYGRILGKVLISPPDSPCGHQADCPKTQDANLLQIKAGMAWWYRHYAKEQAQEDQAAYAAAEFDAKIHRRGLWADTNPMPPWQFRHE